MTGGGVVRSEWRASARGFATVAARLGWTSTGAAGQPLGKPLSEVALEFADAVLEAHRQGDLMVSAADAVTARRFADAAAGSDDTRCRELLRQLSRKAAGEDPEPVDPADYWIWTL